jgi:hypothetical protein
VKGVWFLLQVVNTQIGGMGYLFVYLLFFHLSSFGKFCPIMCPNPLFETISPKRNHTKPDAKTTTTSNSFLFDTSENC